MTVETPDADTLLKELSEALAEARKAQDAHFDASRALSACMGRAAAALAAAGY